ncbi:hypothetical protein [Mycobacterium sp. 1245805.9]|uniref:hypothetical protein n=1 Tax=Mycobacterium sp. 1245805.9 TaxID=1856862 RepID=UPI000800BDB5|nr:hypothetical protein [Mycobacterium sp. 1245805.9]OBI85499.1 hypothetical protein A9X00_27660 [Mycobacterium sp. 1245805.9]
MDRDDPEKRIADLERQLAEQKRIAELERQLAEAKAAAGQNPGEGQSPSFFSVQTGTSQGGDERARQYAESLWEGLRSGGPAGPGGPSGPEMAQHREAFMQAAAQAGLSQEQIDNIFKHGKATFKVGHSVVYSGQGSAPEYRAFSGTAPPPPYAQQVGSRHQVAQGRRRERGGSVWANRFGAIAGTIGLCVGGASALTATMPSTALWTSPIVCDSGYQLAYNTSHYSYKPGQSGTSVDFECVNGADSYDPSWFAIDALQTLAFAVIAGVLVAIGFVVWRQFGKPA